MEAEASVDLLMEKIRKPTNPSTGSRGWALAHLGTCYRRLSEPGDGAVHWIYTKIIGVNEDGGFRLLEVDLSPDWHLKISTVDDWPTPQGQLRTGWDPVSLEDFIVAVGPLFAAVARLAGIPEHD